MPSAAGLSRGTDAAAVTAGAASAARRREGGRASGQLPGALHAMRRGPAMASYRSCPEKDEEEREEAALGKLIVRLTNVQEGKQLASLLQTLEDLLALAHRPRAPRLFGGRNVHVPVLLVLDSYLRVAAVQQMLSMSLPENTHETDPSWQSVT